MQGAIRGASLKRWSPAQPTMDWQGRRGLDSRSTPDTGRRNGTALSVLNNCNWPFAWKYASVSLDLVSVSLRGRNPVVRPVSQQSVRIASHSIHGTAFQGAEFMLRVAREGAVEQYERVRLPPTERPFMQRAMQGFSSNLEGKNNPCYPGAAFPESCTPITGPVDPRGCCRAAHGIAARRASLRNWPGVLRVFDLKKLHMFSTWLKPASRAILAKG